ncbi:molybdenum cofactor biosynthesis protein MoaE [Jonesia denitrificans]|nr:molybdenum cofactor biosynthesis protein MoaE [Jonesia denitrificans]QXB44327.1 molybdenum cofactor biosynthesis protein MoaE [Jonesia denitrificans]
MMMGEVTWTAVTVDPLVVAWHEDKVAHAHMGAVVTFCGVVRDHDGGLGVRALHYEGHPHAADMLAQIADDVARRYGGVRLAVSHRVGDLVVGDVALVASVSSAHRKLAFEVCDVLVDEVKKRLPVWKEQFFVDGSSQWVGAL